MSDIDRSFLGIGWSFPPTFRREWYGVEMLVEEDDVRSSIGIILKTITGERVMLPTMRSSTVRSQAARSWGVSAPVGMVRASRP